MACSPILLAADDCAQVLRKEIERQMRDTVEVLQRNKTFAHWSIHALNRMYFWGKPDKPDVVTLQFENAVNDRGVLQILRYALETGDVQNHVETQVLPDHHHQDRRERGVRLSQETDLRAVCSKEPCEHGRDADLRVIDEFPDDPEMQMLFGNAGFNRYPRIKKTGQFFRPGVLLLRF